MTDKPEDRLKNLNEISMKALSDCVAKALSEQLGGDFDVELTKLERTHPGFSDDKLILQFHVKDGSWVLRIL
jgi:hypothetical protein